MIEHQDDAEIADAIFDSAAVAFIGGQLFVRDVELEGTIKMAADDPVPVLDMPFEEALQLFQSRGLIDPVEFYSDIVGIRQRSFTATRLMTEALRRRAFEELGRIMQDGGTVGDFVSAIEQEEITLGLESDGAYLRTVFHTNIASAYGAGRFTQITHPDVMAARPYVQYRAIMDAQTRPGHAALHGTIYRSESSEWHVIAPPNDFGCRCGFLTLSADEVDGPVLDSVPATLEWQGEEVSTAPGEFFEGPPTTVVEA